MPASTQQFDLTDTEWTLVANGLGFVAIQLNNPSRVRVYVGPNTSPPNNADLTGINLSRGILGSESSFSLGGLPADTGVWARSIRDTVEEVIVLSY